MWGLELDLDLRASHVLDLAWGTEVTTMATVVITVAGPAGSRDLDVMVGGVAVGSDVAMVGPDTMRGSEMGVCRQWEWSGTHEGPGGRDPLAMGGVQKQWW